MRKQSIRRGVIRAAAESSYARWINDFSGIFRRGDARGSWIVFGESLLVFFVDRDDEREIAVGRYDGR